MSKVSRTAPNRQQPLAHPAQPRPRTLLQGRALLRAVHLPSSYRSCLVTAMIARVTELGFTITCPSCHMAQYVQEDASIMQAIRRFLQDHGTAVLDGVSVCQELFA